MAYCFGSNTWAQCLFILVVIAYDLVNGLTHDELEIIVEDKPELCDDYAAIGDTVAVDYTGMLQDGRIFDSSMHDGRQPIRFQLGAGTLIKGWEKGIQGMCVHEKRKLVIPPHLGYGTQGIDGVIPPDAILLFQVHLVSIERPSIFNEIYTVASFAIWPTSLFTIVYYLYHKIAAAAAKEDKRAEKRANKKRR